MYILRNKYGVVLDDIGKMLGGKDHTTVMSGVAKIENELKTNNELKLSYNTILKKLNLE